VSGGGTAGTATANGVSYPHAVSFYVSYCYPTWEYTEYNLGRKYTTFDAVVAPRDDISSADSIEYEVAVDGTTKASGRLALGQDQKVHIDVKSALRLKIGTLLHPPQTCHSPETYLVFGNAALTWA
jgi:hypothetical protein